MPTEGNWESKGAAVRSFGEDYGYFTTYLTQDRLQVGLLPPHIQPPEIFDEAPNGGKR